MSWQDCLDKGDALKITPNLRRASSLKRSAKNMLRFIVGIKVDDNNAAIMLKNAYDALLEILHSMLYAKGYSVLNHICVGYFIRDELKDMESFHVFDKYRKIRNGIVYYGEEIEKEVADNGIKEIKEIFSKIEKQISF